MTSKRPKYIRKEHNGKIVYVPATGKQVEAKSSGLRHARSTVSSSAASYTALGNLTAQMASFVGAVCDRWFPPIALTSAASLTVGMGWFGWQTLTNPDMTYWINQFAPGNLNRKIPAADQPKTIDEIVAQVKRNGKMPGEPIVLGAEFSFYSSLKSATVVAIPIRRASEESDCVRHCQTIQEIQVYRALELPKLIRVIQRQRYFRRAAHVQVNGPSEQDLNRLVQLLTRQGSSEGTSSPLPMSHIKMEETQDGSRWLLLSGLKAKGNATALYGQILWVNPQRAQLNVMLDWLSPSGKGPLWTDMTGDGQEEIVIDQSVELEPSFSVFDLSKSPSGEPWATPIQLSKAAIASAPYQTALRLAKSGLWNQAQIQLEAIKANSEQWPADAQAQLELIKLHAAALDIDANLAFSDPVAEIQSLLIRGQWQAAQAKLLMSRTLFEAVDVILESDNGQLGDRIHTAAQVGSEKTAAIDWGIIYHYARGGKAQAQSWVKTNHPQAQSRLEPLFKKLTYPKSEKSQSTPSASTDLKQTDSKPP